MKTIHKFVLSDSAFDDVKAWRPTMLPAGAQILSVGQQNGILYLWALVSPDAKSEPRGIVIYGTGWNIAEPNLKHLGTVQMSALVWHVFEDLDKKVGVS